MVRTVIFTQSTQNKLNKDGFFSDFIDDSMLDFKHDNCSQAEYYYPSGNLILTKTSDGIVADWRE